MSNLKGKVETVIEIEASPEQYYNIWKQAHHIPNVAGDHIQGVDVHEGDWDSHGGVKSWKYTVGKANNSALLKVVNMSFFSFFLLGFGYSVLCI